jgi:hypothetical protein
MAAVSKLPLESNPIDCDTEADWIIIADPVYPETTFLIEKAADSPG